MTQFERTTYHLLLDIPTGSGIIWGLGSMGVTGKLVLRTIFAGRLSRRPRVLANISNARNPSYSPTARPLRDLGRVSAVSAVTIKWCSGPRVIG